MQPKTAIIILLIMAMLVAGFLAYLYYEHKTETILIESGLKSDDRLNGQADSGEAGVGKTKEKLMAEERERAILDRKEDLRKLIERENERMAAQAGAASTEAIEVIVEKELTPAERAQTITDRKESLKELIERENERMAAQAGAASTEAVSGEELTMEERQQAIADRKEALKKLIEESQ